MIWLGIVTAMLVATVLVGLGGLYVQIARGAITVVRPNHRVLRPLGPIRIEISASPELVFDAIASPYLGHPPASLRDEIEVLERGEGLVVAAHHTKTARGMSTTVESVRFIAPKRVEFRLLRGPVAHAIESFELEEHGGRTSLDYTGELGVDLPLIAGWYAERVVPIWNGAVMRSLERVKASAEERSQARERRAGRD